MFGRDNKFTDFFNMGSGRWTGLISGNFVSFYYQKLLSVFQCDIYVELVWCPGFCHNMDQEVANIFFFVRWLYLKKYNQTYSTETSSSHLASLRAR